MDGKPSWVVKDPLKMQYYRFGEVEAWLMQRMDGSHSLGQLAEAVRQRFGIDAGAASLEPFVRRLKEMGLALRTAAERRILLAEALRRDRKLRLQGHGSTLRFLGNGRLVPLATGSNARVVLSGASG